MKLAPLFTSHAVLQCRRTIPVWGWTAPNSRIRGTINGAVAWTASSSAGKFTLRFPPMPAGGPFELKVVNTDTKETATFEDIMIGEVWLAGGQSNMELPLAETGTQLGDYRENTRDCDRIRVLRVPRNCITVEEETFEGEWRRIDRDSCAGSSAVALWFARRLAEELGVAVGVIDASYGATILESWISRRGLVSYPPTRKELGEADRVLASEELWAACDPRRKDCDPSSDDVERRAVPDRGRTPSADGWEAPGTDDSDWDSLKIPGSWIAQKKGRHGAMWVRRAVEIPVRWAGKPLIFHADGIDKQDVTFFNGMRIGGSGGGTDSSFWNVPRAYPIPGEKVVPGRSVLAVRIYSFVYEGGIIGSDTGCYLACPDRNERLPLAGEWKCRQETVVNPPFPPAVRDGKASAPGNRNTLGGSFNGMILPLVPGAIRGVIWYQGESNAKTEAGAREYRELMKLLYRDWSSAFADGSPLPFLQVELAGFGKRAEYDSSSCWARLRDSQRLAAKEIPLLFTASALDAGDEEAIHCPDKRTVGERLARLALFHVCGRESAVPCGPLPRRVVRRGNTLTVSFDFGSGLHTNDGKPPRGFYVAGAGGVYEEANAVIDGDRVLLHSERVSEPQEIRYAWSNHPVINLYNQAELPAATFEWCAQKHQRRKEFS